ncbi:hypothetical protein MMC25_008109 [Agyrium rufum]|nr:hypothetical protein [Agyrium rufum]
MADFKPPPHEAPSAKATVAVPRIMITFCTQCRWMLRAAYFAQELLSTFGLSLGEISLVPSTGGIFTVDVVLSASSEPSDGGQRSSDGDIDSQQKSTSTHITRIWDRKEKGGFPETKVLKQLVRDLVEPGKRLGHSDRKGEGKAMDSRNEPHDDIGKGRQEVTDHVEGETGKTNREACQDCT